MKFLSHASTKKKTKRLEGFEISHCSWSYDIIAVKGLTSDSIAVKRLTSDSVPRGADAASVFRMKRVYDKNCLLFEFLFLLCC